MKLPVASVINSSNILHLDPLFIDCFFITGDKAQTDSAKLSVESNHSSSLLYHEQSIGSPLSNLSRGEWSVNVPSSDLFRSERSIHSPLSNLFRVERPRIDRCLIFFEVNGQGPSPVTDLFGDE